MSSFHTSLNFVLSIEGGYSNHPNDSGGETNLGISQKFLNSIEDYRVVKDLSYEDVKALYKKHFWFFGTIESQDIANKVFDMSVNMGLKTGIRLLQLSINDCCNNEANVDIDGLFGPKTIFSSNFLPSGLLINLLRLNSIIRYTKIVNGDSSQRVFLLGWIRRALR